MAWKDARDTIAAIPVNLVPTQIGIGAGPRFNYDKNGHEKSIGPQSRRYWLKTVKGYSRGPSSFQFDRHLFDVELIVEYVEKFGNTDEIDVTIGSDYTQLVKAICNDANWNRPASTIVAVNAKSSEIGRFNVEILDGARRLRIVFTVEFES